LTCLRRGAAGPRGEKQPELGLAGLRTILSIHPDRAVMKSATASSGYPGRGTGDGAIFTIAAWARVIEINLAGRTLRRAITTCPDRASGPTIPPGDQLSGGCLSSRKSCIRCGAAKISYYDCLFLRLGQGCAVLSIGPVKIGLFLATLSPDGFPGPFRSCCRLTPYRGYSWRPCFCVPYLRDMKIPQGNS